MATGELLAIELVIGGNEAELVVGGELDMVTAPVLERHVRACAEERDVDAITLDLRAVSFCDGAGLQALARTRRCAATHRLRYRVHPSAPVRRIIEIAGDPGEADALR